MTAWKNWDSEGYIQLPDRDVPVSDSELAGVAVDNGVDGVARGIDEV